jgi:predicted lipase
MTKKNLHLFGAGWLQISTIVANTWLVSHDYMAVAVLCQLAITYIWTYNVQRVAAATQSERLIHAFGAATGSASIWALTSLLQ